MYFRKTCFSHVGRLSLSGFDEKSEAVCETGTSPAEKTEEERNRSQSTYAPMLLCVTCWQSQAISGSQNVSE